MIKIKPFKQSKGYCGPACLKMIFENYGLKYSESKLAKLTNSSRTEGCSEKSIIKLARKLGFNSYVKKRSSINELKSFVKKGIPVIVTWFSPEDAGHYSVVVKIDNENIYFADPQHGKIMKHKLNWFKVRWFDVWKDNLVLREIIVIEKEK